MKRESEPEPYVVVIGAANIDIGGTPYRTLIPADSNPGDIKISYGGVGRNIAHNLALLGVPVKLVTVTGSDVLGADMIEACKATGIDTSYSIKIPDATSSMYMYINSAEGDMEMAVDHMDLVRMITPEYLNSLKSVINSAAAVVSDANISGEAFMHLRKICEVPLYVDPVSTALARRIKPGLDGVDTIKPNALEAEYLTGMTIQTEADYRAAAEAILNMGVRRVFMSMGSEGMIAADRNNMYIVGDYPADVVCTTGAGDSATAAIVWASLKVADQHSLVTAAKAANAVAAMTVSVQDTNNSFISHDNALTRMLDPVMHVKKI